MNAIKDLLASERGFFALAIVIAATVLTGTHTMSIEQWQGFTTSIFGIYVGGKTVTTAVGLLKSKPIAAVAAPVASAAPPVTPAVSA